MCSSTLSLTSALDGVGGQRHAPAVYPRPREEKGYPLYRGLTPRTVQTVVSRYTDWTVVANQLNYYKSIKLH